MPRVEKCAKCGGEVIQRARVMCPSTRSEMDLKARVDGDPKALVLKKSSRSTIHAYICSACGYTELYADNPLELGRAFEIAKAKESKLGLE